MSETKDILSAMTTEAPRDLSTLAEALEALGMQARTVPPEGDPMLRVLTPTLDEYFVHPYPDISHAKLFVSKNEMPLTPLTWSLLDAIRAWQNPPAPRPSATVITPAMVERGAEQLCLNHVSSGAIPWDDLGEVLRDVYRHDVRTVLKATLAALDQTETGSTT